jgi:hypothetical protein
MTFEEHKKPDAHHLPALRGQSSTCLKRFWEIARSNMVIADANLRDVPFLFLRVIVDILFNSLTVLTFWVTLWLKIGISFLDRIPVLSRSILTLISLLLSKVIEALSKLGIIRNMDAVKKIPHNLVHTESDIQSIPTANRQSIAFDLSTWENPKSFIHSILSLSEDGYTILGSPNLRFCFVITDPNKAKPFILLTALVTSFVACLHFIIANRRIPRFFPIFQDVPSSTERVSH